MTAETEREYLSHEEIVELFDSILDRMEKHGCPLDDVNVVFSTFIQHIVIWDMLDEKIRDKVLDECEKQVAAMLGGD